MYTSNIGDKPKSRISVFGAADHLHEFYPPTGGKKRAFFINGGLRVDIDE